MGVRRRGREYALQMLYAMDLTEYLPDEIFAGFNAIQDLNRDAFYYARRLVDGVHGHMDEIDAVLTRFAEHWKIHRMAVVDRNLLRAAVAELLGYPNTPAAIVINESLEIARHYGAPESVQFLNGVLDAIARSVLKQRLG